MMWKFGEQHGQHVFLFSAVLFFVLFFPWIGTCAAAIAPSSHTPPRLTGWQANTDKAKLLGWLLIAENDASFANTAILLLLFLLLCVCFPLSPTSGSGHRSCHRLSDVSMTSLWPLATRTDLCICHDKSRPWRKKETHVCLTVCFRDWTGGHVQLPY